MAEQVFTRSREMARFPRELPRDWKDDAPCRGGFRRIALDAGRIVTVSLAAYWLVFMYFILTGGN